MHSLQPVIMVRYALFTVAGLAVALPLNINLGAYSPALVVGTLDNMSLLSHPYSPSLSPL